jgi:coproporphyrinogen III oxidase
MTAFSTDNKITTDAFLPPTDAKSRMVEFMRDFQDRVCEGLEAVDGGGKFQEDSCDRG